MNVNEFIQNPDLQNKPIIILHIKIQISRGLFGGGVQEENMMHIICN